MGRNVFHSLPVALYPPNLVGYLRICLLGAAVHVRNESPQLCAYLFLFNFILDAVDGILARWLETVGIAQGVVPKSAVSLVERRGKGSDCGGGWPGRGGRNIDRVERGTVLVCVELHFFLIMESFHIWFETI